MPRLVIAAAVVVMASGCPGGTEPNGALILGTWGGQNAGVIVSDTTMHVHFGCTVGDAPRPSLTNGRFEVTGLYNITVHPIDLGIFHPAVFTGRVSDGVMTLTVALSDTSVTLGPIVTQLGRDPQMGPCPICRPRVDSRQSTVDSPRRIGTSRYQSPNPL